MTRPSSRRSRSGRHRPGARAAGRRRPRRAGRRAHRALHPRRRRHVHPQPPRHGRRRRLDAVLQAGRRRLGRRQHHRGARRRPPVTSSRRRRSPCCRTSAESYVSSTGGARIADMLADAPFEVDTHYRANADLDLCVVLAGGARLLRTGLTAAEVYQSLKTYCAERRAAGFRVVVLSVLPRNDSVTFEPARLAFNAMLRDTWRRVRGRLRRHRRRLPHRRRRRQPRPAVLRVRRPASQQRRLRRDGRHRRPRPRGAAVAVVALRDAPARGRRGVGPLAPVLGRHHGLPVRG